MTSKEARQRGRRRQPRTQATRSCLTKRMNREVLAPSTISDVYHSRESLGLLLSAVVIEVAEVYKKDAAKLLMKNVSIFSASKLRLPSSKSFHPLLCTTCNDAGFNFKD